MEISVPWLPGGIRAITLWPFILYRERTPCIEVHERYHWHQAARWFVLPWYIAYLAIGLFYIGRPADEHPLEREGYRLQRECEQWNS